MERVNGSEIRSAKDIFPGKEVLVPIPGPINDEERLGWTRAIILEKYGYDSDTGRDSWQYRYISPEIIGRGFTQSHDSLAIMEIPESLGWGGSRPNTGGARPGSGPLKSVIRNFHPFAHKEKGNTISKVQWEFSRCNSCGAIGWEVAWDESLWNPAAPEGEGWQDVDGLSDRPLVHAEDCSNRG